MPKYEDLPYRPCAGLCVINRKGLVFIGRRTDGPEHVDRTHVWQMPQGGIDEGEKPYPAALRELYEETSIRSVEKLGEIRGWLTYDDQPGSCCRPPRRSVSRPSCSVTCVRALIKAKADEGLWLGDVPEPEIGINDVLIRVRKTGICGTDLHISPDP